MLIGLIITYVLGVGGMFIVAIQLPPHTHGISDIVSSFVVSLIWPFMVVAGLIMKLCGR